MSNTYTILGIHGEDVLTVNEYDERGRLVKEHNVARVRMFIGDKIIDEDFPLPEVHPSIPKTIELYNTMLQDAIQKRMAELEK